MKAVSRFITGVGAAAFVALSAAPAQAEHRDRWDRRGGIDMGDIIQGVAILGGLAAVTSALERDFGRYGYGSRDRYRDGYTNAVNSCGREAERIARGRVRITDVDRTGSDRYRVRGVVEADYAYGGYDRGYDRRYERYDRYDRYDRRYDRYDRRYDRYDRYGRDAREDFTCHARGSGRITDFNL
jgi:hypothetical protein